MMTIRPGSSGLSRSSSVRPEQFDGLQLIPAREPTPSLPPNAKIGTPSSRNGSTLSACRGRHVSDPLNLAGHHLLVLDHVVEGIFLGDDGRSWMAACRRAAACSPCSTCRCDDRSTGSSPTASRRPRSRRPLRPRPRRTRPGAWSEVARAEAVDPATSQHPDERDRGQRDWADRHIAEHGKQQDLSRAGTNEQGRRRAACAPT